VNDLDIKARELYESSPSVKPAWRQLTEVTQGVWREYVEKGWTPADYIGPFAGVEAPVVP
jgi:hypothetical protein